MIKRQLETKLREVAKAYPVVTVTGPRQSGKTTLVRSVFPEHSYVSLESPDEREFAESDPRGFLGRYDGGVILDEVQRVPSLLSYVQERVDNDGVNGDFVLTGSQNFLLLEKVSQTLAGRTSILHLLPFSRAEMAGRTPMALDDIGRTPQATQNSDDDLASTLFTGFYPPIHDREIDPQDWLQNYYRTYVERDVRSILNIGDIETFGRFIRLCAGRSGQLLNISSLGADCGVSHATAKRWLSVLEASFIVYLLRPHHANFSKRLVKSPKLYFLDTGLLCYLLRVRDPRDLLSHAARGAVFENFVVAELLKDCWHRGREADIYFWRDSVGHEVDIVVDRGSVLTAIEAKSGQTLGSDFLNGLEFWRSLPEQGDAPCALVYGGDKPREQRGIQVYSWRDWL